MQEFMMRIGGLRRPAAAGGWFESLDPYTGEKWARFPRGSAEDVDAAVKAANEAFTIGPWSSMTASERGLLLYRLADRIAENAEKLADAEISDNGKLKSESLGQMRYLPQWFRYYGGLADKIEGHVTPTERPDIFHYSTYEPFGVVAAIAPWNSPLLLAAWKIAPALAAGNTIVVKPSEFSPASTILFADLCHDAGIPAGVMNVVTGFGPEVGQSLVEHPGVARVAFTGSEDRGRQVYTTAASSFKRVSLELGGKSANIVFPDADLEEAGRGVISGIFAASGQSCMAGSRLLVHASIHDQLVDWLVNFMRSVRLGDPRRPETNMGPMATVPQFEKVLRYFEIAKAEGARCVLGGIRSERPGCERGLFVEPTIFVDVRNDMRIAREEVFGPVLAVIKFDSDHEAIELANDTPFGLAAGVWTRDLERALTIPKRLRAGTVWVNAYRIVSYMAPFGGVKASGLGRENGARAIYEYLEEKSIFINAKGKTPNPFGLN